MSMDLDEILQVFFEETDDHLNTLETLLSELRPTNVSDATVNAILRAAHSIKGNSATCGLSQVSKVAHEMESLLDVVRQRQGALNASAVRLLLEGKDQLSAQLDAYRSGMEFPEDSVVEMCHRLEAIKKTLPPYGSVVSDVDDTPAAGPAPAAPAMQPALSAKEKLEKLLSNNERTLQIIFVLDSSSFPVENVFQAMAEFGEYTIIDTRTPKNQGYHEKKVLYHVNLTTLAPEKEIRDTLGFVVDDEESILIDVIQGPNDDHFGLFDVVFSEEDHAKPHVHALDAFPPLPVGPMDIEMPTLVEAPTESQVLVPETAPVQSDVEEDDPWGMDALARPEEKLAAIDIDGAQPTRAASPVSLSLAPVVAQGPIASPIAPSAPAPAARTKQEDDADELFRELAALDIPAPAPEMLSFPELSAITLPGMEPSDPVAQLPTPGATSTLPVAKPSVEVAPGMTAGPTYVLDHPLTKNDYLKTPVVAPPNVKTFATPSLVKTPSTGSRQFQRAADRKEAAADAVSLRVNLQKVESVVDLVGELVIAQNQLQQATEGLDPIAHAHVFDSLAEVTEHTKALQEAVLSIRMTPMSTVFNRFYRMVRELNLKLGKHVVMKTMGENTEMDKILVEKLVDPLAHIVRNSMDHGIETTADRIAAGKPEQGYILLRAFHRANAIIIEIMDDGRGMHRDKILQKAEEKGLLKKDPAEMSDSEVWNLIFEPGFSTAAVVTDVSGRGVGRVRCAGFLPSYGTSGRTEHAASAQHPHSRWNGRQHSVQRFAGPAIEPKSARNHCAHHATGICGAFCASIVPKLSRTGALHYRNNHVGCRKCLHYPQRIPSPAEPRENVRCYFGGTPSERQCMGLLHWLHRAQALDADCPFRSGRFRYHGLQTGFYAGNRHLCARPQNCSVPAVDSAPGWCGVP